jgi:hypothetical protein
VTFPATITDNVTPRPPPTVAVTFPAQSITPSCARIRRMIASEDA